MADLQEEVNAARRDVLGWLILSFRPPTTQALEQLAGVDLSALTRSAGLRPVAMVPVVDERQDPQAFLKDLSSEYVRLFVNSPHTPVAFLDAASYFVVEGIEAQTALLDQLAGSMSAAGLAVPEGSVYPMDHLTTLLEFLYWSSSAGCVQHNEFVLPLLASWVPKMLSRLEAAQPAAFYQNAAQVLAAYLDIDVNAQPSVFSQALGGSNGFAARTQAE